MVKSKFSRLRSVLICCTVQKFNVSRCSKICPVGAECRARHPVRLGIAPPGDSPGIGAGLIVLAAVTSVLSLAKQLPLQNVLAAAVITAFLGGIAFSLTAQPAIAMPFGPIVFQPGAGSKIFSAVPWPLPLLCVIAIFNARGVSRYILRPWRKTKRYGWWVIGLSAVLVTAFDLALEPFAVHAAHIWLWQPTKIPATWQGASPLDPVGWFVMTLLILAIITPWLIRKQPGRSHAKGFHPVVIWLGSLLLFAVEAARNGMWGPIWIDAGLAAVTLLFVVRGVKW